jgi:pSer/pThr/pTyr-binding forkhead associated (FHA) protein
MRNDDHPPIANAGFFESFDALAHLVRNGGPNGTAAEEPRRSPPAAAPVPGAEPAGPPAQHGRVHRPTVRRPMALVHVIDDGREDGEIVRMRGDRLVVGRVDGDVVIPHDLFMSPTHASLERLPEGGWRLADLGSATGTFVRVDRARLRHERMIQVGSTRLRFHEVDLTEAWLIEVTPTGVGRRHECHAPVTTIGRGGCTIAIDDPFVDDVHAEIRRTHTGWRIRNTGANGLWVRLDEPLELHAPAQFLCGEQRFVFEPLG